MENRMQLTAVLSVITLACVGCGISEDDHNRVVRELEVTKKQLAAANKRVHELEVELEQLSRTDSGHWSKILDLKAKSQWPNVISEIDEFLDSWPSSPYIEQARKLRAEAIENQAGELLAQAESEIEQQQFEQAKATLLQITKGYPATRARARADDRLRTLDRKIAEARRRAVGNGAWSVNAETSPIDDSTNVDLSLASTSTIDGQFGSAAQPYLYVRCKERKTEVFVVWDVYLGIGETDVLNRLDDSPARTLEWSISTDYKATFYPGNDIAFARELQKHERLLLRVTPYGEKPVTATFDLAGLENAIEPLKKACRWM
jgi:type VI secretion system protein VasI